MLVGEDRKQFSTITAPEIRLRPAASDAVGYQLIDVGDNKTSSDVLQSSRHAVVSVNQSSIKHANQAPTKPPKSVVLTSSLTSALRHAAESVNISYLTTAEPGHKVLFSTKSRLRLETEVTSITDSASGDDVTTKSTYHDSEQSATTETSASTLPTADNTVNKGSRKRSLLLTISGENRPHGSSSNRSSDTNSSAITFSVSRDQSASTTWLPEVDNATESTVENRTDVWNVEELNDSTRSTAIRVRYVHTLLTESGDGRAKGELTQSEVASITAACAFCFFFVVAVVVVAIYRHRRTCGRSKVVGGDGRKGGPGDDKLKVLRRVAAESDTLSPDLLDQIIRAELARGRAKRYRARLRDGDDREQLERLAVEMSDDWGTPPPSYRRLTPAGTSTHRRQLWPGDSPARVHDLQPPLPDLPPPIPERSSARPAAMPLDFRLFRRPLPEVPRQQSADACEMFPRSVTPKLSDMKTVRCEGPWCDVVPASPRIVCDVIRSPLPVAVCAQDGGTDSRNKRLERRRDVIIRSCDIITASPRLMCDVRSPLPFSNLVQDGGTGSEKRRRFPKMGRSCLLESLRQRGDCVAACSVVGHCPLPTNGPNFHEDQSPGVATRSPPSGCACNADLHHPAMTSWTRDLSHLPILRDTTV